MTDPDLRHLDPALLAHETEQDVVVPDDAVLAHGLARILSPAAPEQLTAMTRSVKYTSTYPTERVDVEFSDGRRLRLFCKYSREEYEGHDQHGHRGGIRYEAEIYRRVLAPLRLPAVRFYGTHEQAAPPKFWLILDSFDGGIPVSWLPRRDSLALAGSWLGRFQLLSERLPPPLLEWLQKYDAEYYRGWARRTLEFAHRLDEPPRWLSTLQRRYEELLPMLLTRDQVLVHGEFYGKNVLIRGSEIYALDWESAALGPAEVDLATITEGWPKETEEEIIAAYVAERWNGIPPPDFTSVLAAARLYVSFRWLGDRLSWTIHPGAKWRFDMMKELGESMGVL